MKTSSPWLWLLVCCWPGVAGAQWQLLPEPATQSVFAGGARKITCVWHNSGDQTVAADLRVRMLQASSAMVIPLGETPWKPLQVLPGQTVLESASLDFPPVKAEAKFLVQWLENSNHLIGTTTVRVYPTNLLAELNQVVIDSGENLGVLDPRHLLQPVLKHAGIKFVDLEEAGLADFSGRLALVGLCGPDDPEWSGLDGQISQLARKGTPVVWMQSPSPKPDKITPSFYVVPVNTNAVVVVRPELLASLADQPQSQLNLLYFCRLALRPEPFQLPNLAKQP